MYTAPLLVVLATLAMFNQEATSLVMDNYYEIINANGSENFSSTSMDINNSATESLSKKTILKRSLMKFPMDIIYHKICDFGGSSFKETGCEWLNPREEDEICFCTDKAFWQIFKRPVCYYAKVRIFSIRKIKMN